MIPRPGLARPLRSPPLVEPTHQPPAPERVVPHAGPSTDPADLCPESTIRDVLAAWPQLYPVFQRHGLGGCGGPRGPLERIDEFARLHRVDLPALMADLRQARLAPPIAPPAPSPEPLVPEAGPVFPPFLVAGLLATLTLGATLGAYNLLAIQLAVGPFDPASSRIHAAFQIYGFVLLFVVGVAYHVIPRFLGCDLAAPGLARASLAPLLGGLGLQLAGTLAGGAPERLLSFAGSLGILVGVALFAGVMAATWKRSGVVPEPFHHWLVLATGWWMAAAALSALGQGLALREGGLDPVLALNEATYWAALLGGASGWIQGVLLRTSPGFLGLAPQLPRPLSAAFLLCQAGCLAAVVGAVGHGAGGAPTLRNLGLVAYSAGLLAFVHGARLFVRERPLTASHAAAFERTMRAAFAGALLFALLGGGHALLALVGARAPAALFDAGRHSLTLGFVTLSIFGMAGRIVPVFMGAHLRFPALWSLGCTTVFLSLLARICQVPAALLASPELLQVSAASGPLGALGVAAASAAILGTLLAGEERPRTPRAVAVEPGVRVSDLVDAHPATLEVLVRAGFTPLANPIARRTLARFVTLGQACEMHGIPLEPLLDALRRACEPPAPAAPPPGGGCGMRPDARMEV